MLWARLDHPRIERFWADQGFAGRLVEWTARILGRELDIVRKAPDHRSFQVQPKRWAIERTFSWLTAHRRLARDYETSPAHSETLAGLHAGPFATDSLLTSATAGDPAAGTSSASATVDQLALNLGTGLSGSLTGVNSTCTAGPDGATGNGTIASSCRIRPDAAREGDRLPARAVSSSAERESVAQGRDSPTSQ